MASIHQQDVQSYKWYQARGSSLPVLFSIYLDELLHRITDTGFGCFIGTSFMGCFAYAYANYSIIST